MGWDPIQTHVPHIVNIDKIVISHGESVDGIQVDYAGCKERFLVAKLKLLFIPQGPCLKSESG